jgi:hypothetical protein
MNLNETIAPDSTQLNAEDMLAGPITVTITAVERGTPDQPVNILLAEFPDRAYRPCKSMRRVLVAAWGPDASIYTGRRITLFNDPTVKWGGAAVGGVRISHLSDITARLTLSLTTTRGKRAPFIVEPLPDAPPATVAADLVENFSTQITDAATLDDLDKVAKKLKSQNLGAHREQLVAAWTERRAVISAEVTA